MNMTFNMQNMIFGGSLVVMGLAQIMMPAVSLWLAVLILGILFIVER